MAMAMGFRGKNEENSKSEIRQYLHVSLVVAEATINRSDVTMRRQQTMTMNNTNTSARARSRNTRNPTQVTQVNGGKKALKIFSVRRIEELKV